MLNILPKKNISNLIIILSCRPNPNVFDNAFLPYDHDARKSKIYKLSQSQYVKDIKILAQSELQELYEDEKAKRIIALLAVSQGALNVSDLCAITNATYQIDVKKIFNDSKSRIFMSLFLMRSRLALSIWDAAVTRQYRSIISMLLILVTF